MLLFGLGTGVVVNSIIGLPILRQWGGNLDFNTNAFIATHINTCFPLHCEPTKQGFPPTVEFSNSSFVCPRRASFSQASIMFMNIDDRTSMSTTEKYVFSGNKLSTTITNSHMGICFKCNVTTSHLL